MLTQADVPARPPFFPLCSTKGRVYLEVETELTVISSVFHSEYIMFVSDAYASIHSSNITVFIRAFKIIFKNW